MKSQSQQGLRKSPVDEYVEFWRAGVAAKGEFRCVACGYAIVTRAALPACPMCRERLWERAEWSPFSVGRR
jgi:rubrerythrin